jgi:hypothetical protein
LLLYKEALLRLSPDESNEVLVKARIIPTRGPNGEIVFKGDGKKTADIQQIKERFEELGISTDWVRFDRITNVRNEIEHYYTTANQRTLDGVISDAFVIIRNYVTTELNEDALNLFGQETWEVMLRISEVYEAERAECENSLRSVDWGSDALREGVFDLSCPSCSGGLLRPDGEYASYSESMGLQCRACGEVTSAHDFVPLAIAQALDGGSYESFEDGSDEMYITCPVCQSEAYVMDEERCAFCGESAQHKCERCGCEIPASELHCSPYCGYCEHMLSKDD